MSKQTEALKLALEALEAWKDYYATHWDKIDEQAITAIREALADSALKRMAETERELGLDYMQPAQQQEPVAWMWRCKPYCNWPEWSVSLKRPADSGRDGHKRTEGYEDVPLYTFPPASKPWVGLTQQDIDIAFDDTQEGGGFNEFARAIEAKLKEKNT